MTVRSTDGEKLGKVIACEADRFFIEKGFFFPKDYVARYDDVGEVRGDEILLRHTRAELRGEGAAAGAASVRRRLPRRRSGRGWRRARPSR
jgi:hypothetical protein